MFAKIKKFFVSCADYCKVCYNELAHNTTWPTRKELTHSAMVVLTATLICALVVFVMDLAFKNFMLLIYPN